MPTTLTYTSLISDLQSYLERASVLDTTVYDQLPRLINLAERRIAHELKIQGQEYTTTGNLVSGTATLAKPSDWRETISLSVTAPVVSGQLVVLRPRSLEYIYSYWPSPSSTGTPKFYAERDYTTFLIAPTPSANFAYTLQYWRQLPLLDAMQPTNWLTDYAPDLLLFACLMEAATFLKAEDLLEIYGAQYQQVRSAITGEDVRKLQDRAAVREG